jgi:hypothetical protein
MEVRSRLAADGYVRGGKESQTRAGELRRLVSRRQVATRLTGLHLDFTVEFFNHSPFDFEGRSLEIPVKAGSEVLAIAQSVGAAGPVPAFRIPAGRGRAIPVRFRADLDTTRSLVLLDEMAKGGLFLAIEESQGGLVAVGGDSPVDAIS